MSKEKLNYKEIKLTDEESNKILIFQIIVIFASLFFSGFISLLIYLIFSDTTIIVLSILFIVLISSVFQFFFYKYIQKQKKKISYIGIVTDKYAVKTPTMTKNGSFDLYRLKLDGVEFELPYNLFRLVEIGQKIDLIQVGREVSAVSLVEDLTNKEQNHDLYKEISSQIEAKDQIQTDEDKIETFRLTKDYYPTVFISFLQTFIIRLFISFIPMVILLLILTLTFSVFGLNYDTSSYFSFPIIIILFFIINRKVFLKTKDLILKNSVEAEDVVFDLIKSNKKKISKTTSIGKVSDRTFFYLETPTRWIEINEVLYHELKKNDKVIIRETKNGQINLEVMFVSKKQ